MRNKAIIFFLLVLLLIPVLSLAQVGGGGGTGTGGGGGTGTGGGGAPGTVTTIELRNPLSCEDAECLLMKILNAFWIIASLLSTLMVLIGAFQLMTAAGNPEKVQTAKKTLLYAVIGYAVVILAYSANAIIKGIVESASQGTSQNP